MNGRAWLLKCRRVNIKSLIGWRINNIAFDHSVLFVDRSINGDSYRNLYCILLKIMNSLSQLLLKQKQWREWGTLSKFYTALVLKCQEDLVVVINLVSRCKSLSNIRNMKDSHTYHEQVYCCTFRPIKYHHTKMWLGRNRSLIWIAPSLWSIMVARR